MSETSATPSWVWWVLALALVAALVGIPLWLRARGRARRWAAELDAATADAIWLCRTVVPQLVQQSPTMPVAGGWAVALPRVVAAEDKLTALEPAAPDEEHAVRVRTLREGLRAAHARLDAVARATDPAVVASELAGTAAALEQVIVAVTPETPSQV